MYVHKEADSDQEIILQDDDSFIQGRLIYDMGVESHHFRFYFRNGYPYVTELPQYTTRLDDDSLGHAESAYDDFEAECYVPSEKHEYRGAYWPGNDD